MLYFESQALILIFVIAVLAATAIVGLITREAPGEPIKPATLSEEDRLLLQSSALDRRKQERADGKKTRRRQAQSDKGELDVE